MAKHIPIEETPVFEAFERCSEVIWASVVKWPQFPRDTVGKQLTRAIDSVGANLVEGDGRYGDGEALHHFVIARASAREAALWFRRAQQRGLLQDPNSGISEQLNDATRQLNSLINYRRRHAETCAKEEVLDYVINTEHSTLNTER